MKKLMTILPYLVISTFFVCAVIYFADRHKDSVQNAWFHNNVDSATRYNQLLSCSYMCEPDSVLYYNRMFMRYVHRQDSMLKVVFHGESVGTTTLKIEKCPCDVDSGYIRPHYELVPEDSVRVQWKIGPIIDTIKSSGALIFRDQSGSTDSILRVKGEF